MKYGNIQKNNYYIEIKHNEEDDFSQCLIINGLYARDGGNPVDYIINKIVTAIRDKLKRRHITLNLSKEQKKNLSKRVTIQKWEQDLWQEL